MSEYSVYLALESLREKMSKYWGWHKPLDQATNDQIQKDQKMLYIRETCLGVKR